MTNEITFTDKQNKKIDERYDRINDGPHFDSDDSDGDDLFFGFDHGFNNPGDYDFYDYYDSDY